VFQEDIIGTDGADTAKLLRTSHGSRVLAMTKNPKNVRSQPANRIYLDEFGIMEEQEALFRAAKPATARKGVLTLFSNPEPTLRGCLFERICRNHESLGYWYDEVPYTECPDLTPDFIERAREECRVLGLSFASEFECSFDADSDLSPIQWHLLTSVVTDQQKTEGGVVVMGWDPGKTRHTSSVLIMRMDRGVKEVIHLEGLSGRAYGNAKTPYPEQTRRIFDLVEEHKVDLLFLDEWAQGEPLADFLGPIKQKVRRVKLKTEDKRAAMRYIAFELERGNFWIRRQNLANRLMRDLNNFDLEKGEFSQNSDGHGDLGVSLILAWQAVPRQTRRITRDVTSVFRSGDAGPRIGGRRVPLEAIR
jgi:hypothetical protein